jgi:glucose-6-phosphate 1-dehydrogenase
MNSHHPETTAAASPCVMVIFGASGDLTKRKLIPALCNLAADNVLPKQFAIVGLATNDFTTETFRQKMAEEIPKYAPLPVDPKLWAWFNERIYYVKGDFGDSDAFKRLKQQIADADKEHDCQGNKLFYLAVAPRFFSPITKMLGDADLVKEDATHWARVIVEKPFGHDLASAVQLNKDLNQVLTEKQIYRIDHYLGKETVQNVMVFRFSNNIIEALES